jgi:hypothetical protein
MNLQKDLELLKDDEQYYSGVGKKYLSNSDIGTLLTDPSQYGLPREDTPNFALGRLFHYCLIEPDKVDLIKGVNASSRRTNKYTDALMKSSEPFLLLQKEVDQIKHLANKMKESDYFSSIIYEMGNQYEVPAIKEVGGLLWKGKTDILRSDSVVDLKTTSSIKDFKWNAKKYNYDSQAYLYRKFFGKPMIFLVAEKNSNRLAEFPCAESFYESGKDKVIRAINQYNKFFGSNATEDVRTWFHREELF